MKDTKTHFVWNPDKLQYEYQTESEGWFEKLSKIFAGLTYFGGLGISSGEGAAEAAGAIASAGTDGTALAEEIPLVQIDEPTLFSTPHSSDVVVGGEQETSFVTGDEDVLFDVNLANEGPRTSTPARAGRPNINRQPAVYEGDLELEDLGEVDPEDEVIVTSKGTGKNHKLVYAKGVPKSSTRSGRTLKNILFRSVSTIEPELEMEPLISEIEPEPSTEIDPKADWVPVPTRPIRDGRNWGRWQRGNWSYGFNKGRFHLNYKTAKVKFMRGKLYVSENGKWMPKEIPKTVVWAIKQETGKDYTEYMQKGRGKRATPTPEQPLIPSHSQVKPAPFVPPIEPVSKKRKVTTVKKRRCSKRRGKKCIKYDV